MAKRMLRAFRGTAVVRQVVNLLLLTLFAGMPQALDALQTNKIDSAAAYGALLLQEEEWKADDGVECGCAAARTLSKPLQEGIRCPRYKSVPVLGHERIAVPPPKA